MYVYISNDKQTWTATVTDKIISSTTPSWIDCGYSSNAFRYVNVLVYNNGSSAQLNVDSISVTP